MHEVLFFVQPIEVYPTDESKLTLHGLVQYYVKLDEGKKTRKLYELLTKLEYNQTMVFVKSGKRAKTLQTILVENGQPCGVVTGNMDVKTRSLLVCSFVLSFEHPVFVAYCNFASASNTCIVILLWAIAEWKPTDNFAMVLPES